MWGGYPPPLQILLRPVSVPILIFLGPYLVLLSLPPESDKDRYDAIGLLLLRHPLQIAEGV